MGSSSTGGRKTILAMLDVANSERLIKQKWKLARLGEENNGRRHTVHVLDVESIPILKRFCHIWLKDSASEIINDKSVGDAQPAEVFIVSNVYYI